MTVCLPFFALQGEFKVSFSKRCIGQKQKQPNTSIGCFLFVYYLHKKRGKKYTTQKKKDKQNNTNSIYSKWQT